MSCHCLLPLHLKESIARYVEHGIQPGGFLCAVISNDLKEAMGRADERNRLILFDIVSHLYNCAPSACWGSPDKLTAWIRRFEALDDDHALDDEIEARHAREWDDNACMDRAAREDRER